MGRKQSAQAAWRGRLAKYSKSSLSVTEFCRQQGLSVPSFYQWRKRLSGNRDGVHAKPQKPSPAKALQEILCQLAETGKSSFTYF